MADTAPRKLTMADQALAHLVGFIATQRMVDDRNTVLALDLLREIEPHVTRDIPQMAALAAAAIEMIAAYPDRSKKGGAMPWCAATWSASSAASAFLFWRAAVATEAWRASLPVKEEHAA